MASEVLNFNFHGRVAPSARIGTPVLQLGFSRLPEGLWNAYTLPAAGSRTLSIALIGFLMTFVIPANPIQRPSIRRP